MQQFKHALKIDHDTCIGCAHCIRVCPTEALRVNNGKAILHPDKCVDCGECYRVCPVSAIKVEHDDFSRIFDYPHRILLIPAVFLGQFSHKFSVKRIMHSLRTLGFTEIFEIEKSIEPIKDNFNFNVHDENAEKPVISTFCPAIIRLIQVSFPGLVFNIAQYKAPLDLAAHYVKKELMEQGTPENDIGIFYVTPCAAKIAAVKSPVGEEKSIISGVINMDFLYNKVRKEISDNPQSMDTDSREVSYTGQGLKWSLTNGEASHIKGKSLAIDAMPNVIDFLEKVENEEIKGVDFLELRACDQGCAGGILTSGNRFLTVENLCNKAVNNYLTPPDLKNKINAFREFIEQGMHLDNVMPRPIHKLDEDFEIAMKKMEKIRKYMCFLPGIDCGTCGAPSCRALAEDIVRGQANISDYIFIQRCMVKSKLLSQDTALKIMEKIWGKNRFEKDCNKKGAENENI